MKNLKLSLSEFGAVLLLVIGVYVGLMWLVWMLYKFVATSMFPEASAAVTQPGFLVFFAAVTLVSWVGDMFRSKK